MPKGVAFPVRHVHERFHLGPLEVLLADLPPVGRPAVVVQADTRPPVRGAWNVQVFHGLGDKQYTGNPLYLQRARFPRVRTAGNMVLRRLGLPARLLTPPAAPGRRPCRYDQVNAYGPRLADRLEEMLRDTAVSRFGHIALNAREGIRMDPSGPVVWLPTWDNRAFLGGPAQSSLEPFAPAVQALAEAGTPIVVKPHPLTLAHDQAPEVRAALALHPRIRWQEGTVDPYALLQGARALLTDTSSLGFEAACCGLPTAVLKAGPWRLGGLHDELEAHVPTVAPGDDLQAALDEARTPAPRAWREDLLAPPKPAQNMRFAAALRQQEGARSHGDRP